MSERRNATRFRGWPLLGVLAPSACLVATLDPVEAAGSLDRRIEVRCASGRSFVAGLRPGTAVVIASGRRYRLDARLSSLGVRYVSGEAAFALDEDRAVLIGATGGPYQDCKVSRPLRMLHSNKRRG